MKKAALIGLLAVVVGVVSSRPADAQSGIIRWIEKLSGPGDFIGPGYEFYPLCFGRKNGLTRERGNQVIQEEVGRKTFGVDLNCRSFTRDKLFVVGGGQAAYLSGKNNLQYDSSVPDSFTKRVEALLFMGTVDANLAHRAVALGGGTGFMRFYGMPARAFNHQIHNIRVTLKPYAFRRVDIPDSSANAEAYRLAVLDRYEADWLQIRLDFDFIPGGLEDTDFGAIPGTFPETSAETSIRLSVAFNLGSKFRW